MKKMKYFALAALTLALGACSDDYEFFGDSKRIIIEAGFGTSSRVATNGLSSMFEADDAIGVYVWTGSTALPDVAAGYVANNVTNTFDGKNWTATPQMLWKDTETPHYFLSVYPQTDILTTTAYTLDPADQEKSDLLVATNFGADNGGIVPQSNPVPLAFGHVMAKLRVNLKFNDEFTTAPAVELLTAVAQSKATIDWQTATATATGDATGVELPALSVAAQGYACSYESVMVPQSGFKSVVVVIGGETYTFTSTKEMQLKKGTITTLNLSVGLTSIQAEDITILDWTLGTSIDGYLNNIDAQLAAIQSSLGDLATVDSTMQTLIDGLDAKAVELQEQLEANATADAATKKALEDEITALMTLIDGLKEKDAELAEQTTALQAYTDSLSTADKDWASATFATLEKYTEMQTTIATLQALVENNQTDVTAAYTQAITDAITASEASMMTWVNDTLAAGYYDIATMDGKLEALSASITEGDAALKAQIEAQQTALEEAKTELTAAYEKAINDAIAEDGSITTAIADAVKASQDILEGKISAIAAEIETIKGDIAGIKESINTINQQITAINGSIDDLKAVDTELSGYISALQTTATDLQSQIDAANTALAALKSDLEGQITASEQKVINELNTVKTTLEGQLATINSTIATLQAKDAELEQKIADLQKYVDGEIKATEDWASATFSTLEQYEATQTAISEINALITSTQGSITALEEKLGKKIADDIAAAVAGVNAGMAAKVTEITDAYTAAIATAKSEIEAAYTDAIKAAITASEASMQEWVNKTLSEGYYDIASMDGKLEALSASITEGDAALKAQIEAQQTALEEAKTELTAAYEKAINDAIAEGGSITTAIADAVKASQDILEGKISAVAAEIETIKGDIAGIKESINTINGQIEGIKTSLGDLEAMDTQLNGYIETLQATATDLSNQITAANTLIDNVKQEMGDEIDAVEQRLLTQLESLKTTLEGQLADVLEDIETLEAKDTELDGKITELKTYVDTQFTVQTNWANATFATLEKYEEVQTTISGINTTIAGINTSITDLETRINEKIATDIQAAIDALPDYAAQITTAVTNVTDAYTAAIATAKGEITTAYTAAIAAAISNLETSMKEWVNTEIAKAYYNKTEIDAKLEALQTEVGKYTDADELQAAITTQQSKLETAVSELTTAYQAAITEAITNNNGTIDTKIAAAITEANTDLETKITEINTAIVTINTKLEALEDDVEALKARIQSIRFLPEYSDGKVKIGSASSPVELTFIVSPKEAAAAIAVDAIAAEKVKAFIYHTQSRAVDAQQLTITRVIGDADTGMLTVTVTSPTDDYWATGKTANIYIQINDGNNDIISEMIPAYYDVEPDYVTFSATEVQTFSWAVPVEEGPRSARTSRSETGHFEYSVGGDDWATLTESLTVIFGGTNGDLRLRGIAPEGTNGKIIAFGNETLVACSGDIRTLVDWKNHTGANTENAVFKKLFNNCTQLTSAPALPATTLAELCYYNMFNNCTQLTSAPALPATTLAVGCYFQMFYGCLRLFTAPVLPATELAVGCYEAMFYGCTSLTAAPKLEATTLVTSCYCDMFNGCSNLSSVTMLATEGFDEDYCLESWLYEVNPTGTFTRAEGMESIPTNSVHGIPTGWTVKVKSVEQEQETLPGFNYVNGY